MSTRPTSMRPTGMRRVVVTGMGVVSSLGDSPSGLHSALVEGEHGARPVSLFETNGLGPLQAGEVPDFAPESYLGRVNLRPVDRTARLVIVASHLAFEQSGWTREKREEQDVGLVLGTMFGSIHTISAFDRRALVAGPSYAKPFDFANSVINAAAGQTAIWHALRGINSTVAGGTTAGCKRWPTPPSRSAPGAPTPCWLAVPTSSVSSRCSDSTSRDGSLPRTVAVGPPAYPSTRVATGWCSAKAPGC